MADKGQRIDRETEEEETGKKSENVNEQRSAYRESAAELCTATISSEQISLNIMENNMRKEGDSNITVLLQAVLDIQNKIMVRYISSRFNSLRIIS